MATPDEANLFIGKVLNGRWRVLKHIGGGGFGLVFAGEEVATGDEVAIKILSITKTTPECVLEFTDEVRYLRRLVNCERVINVLDGGKDQQIVTAKTVMGEMELALDLHYMVLELADSDLTRLLVLDFDEFDWPERIAVFRDVVKGVHQMHLRQVVNRDLKSENVLMFAQGRGPVSGKVADLGRSRITTEPPRFVLEAYLAGRGDRRFAAPELLWHLGADTDTGWRSVDLYHLGSVLYELATGIGITASVLPDPLTTVGRTALMSPPDRFAEYSTIRSELQDRYDLVYELFSEAVPMSIRLQMTALLRQLTSLDQIARFPRSQGRSITTPGLPWLIRRVDILALTLRNAQREQRRNHDRRIFA